MINNRKIKATINCIKDCETILNGEYYVIHSDYIIALEEEIEKLEYENEELNRMCEIYSKSLYNADLKSYKERIDKATEYIRSNEWAKDYENSNCRTHLLDILQGKDENK